MANRVTTFISEAKAELKKVTWPSRKELYAATIMTLTITFIIALYIGIVDFFISKIIAFLIR